MDESMFSTGARPAGALRHARPAVANPGSGVHDNARPICPGYPRLARPDTTLTLVILAAVLSTWRDLRIGPSPWLGMFRSAESLPIFQGFSKAPDSA